MPLSTSFQRQSVAYINGGYRQKTGTPRFETGKFSGTKALRVEEGTTDEFTANQSQLKSGWTSVDLGKMTFSFDSTNGALTATCNTTLGVSDNAYVEVSFLTSQFQNQTITFSVTALKLAGSWPASGHVIDILTDSGAGYGTTSTTLTADGRYQVSRAVPASPAQATLVRIRFAGTTIVSGLQIKFTFAQVEQKTFATTWQIGATARAAEACFVPAADLFSASEGTIEAWIYLEDNTSGTHTIVGGRQPGDGFANTSRIYFEVVSGTLTFGYWNGSTNREITGGSISLNTWTHVGAKWASAGSAIYKNGASQATHADAPSLTVPPRLGIGARLDATRQLNGLLGGLRLTTRARTDADILAAYNANVQFTEDGADATVFTFHTTIRALLTAGRHQVVPETAFVIPTSTTASTTATDYLTASITDYEFPTLPHRTTSTGQTTLTFDFGDVVNIRAIFAGLINWNGFQLAMSYDNATFTDVSGSPFAAFKDEVDQYRKWGSEVAVNGRYARVIIPAQLADEQAAYFETPLFIFASDLDNLEANPNWGMTFGLAFDYDNNDAGGHSEPLAKGKQYLTMQVRSDGERGVKSNEWMQLGALGDHRKFLLLTNLGKSQECYLMRSAGNLSWEEQSGHNTFSTTWREHIN